MRSGRAAVCADVGSTFTKVAVVDLETGALLATAARSTTVGSDVLHGLDAAVAAATAGLDRSMDISTTYVCSSAGGGLRLAVVGYEHLVTAQAGHRVGLSAGARVVHVTAGRLDLAGLDALRADRPDVVLLVGGTDGGDDDVLRHNASRLAAARLRVPVVVAGNVDAREDVVAVLAGRGVPVVAAANVLPRIGVLNPGPARAAIRAVFLRHVIGGKRLSRGPRFASLVRGATPDVVLTAVEFLAAQVAGDLLVVDIGGATTDVYSVRTPDPAAPPGSAEVAGTLWQSRTVEGDLGMRWSAGSVLAAARAERLSTGDRPDAGTGDDAALAAAARLRAEHPDHLATTDADQRDDATIARLAAIVALRRHARGDGIRGGIAGIADTGSPTPPGGLSAMDLSRVRLLIGSGGVLRHAPAGVADGILRDVLADHAGGWAPPRTAATVVDLDYVLAPAGLLVADHPGAARALLARFGSGYTADSTERSASSG